MKRGFHPTTLSTLCGLAAWSLLCGASLLPIGDQPARQAPGDQTSGLFIGSRPAWISAEVEGHQGSKPQTASVEAPIRHRASGILIDHDDGYATVKTDGEDQPVRYLADVSDLQLERSLKLVFDASRVELVYVQAGKSRQLRSIRPEVLPKAGTLTGQVARVYNNYWVEVKPGDGPSDAFAPGSWNYNDPAFMDQLRGLQPGDSVTISYNTDFERHRILSLKINSRAAATTSER